MVGFIPDSWFKKQQVTWIYQNICCENWWKADAAIGIFCGGAIWLLEFLEDVFFEEETEKEATETVQIKENETGNNE